MSETDAGGEGATRRPGRLLGVVVVALLIPILPFLVVGELPGERWLSAMDRNAWLFGATGGGLLAADVLLPIPSSIVGTLLGARLGFLSGLVWCWGGLLLGNLVGYGAGRLLLGRFTSTLPTAPTALVLFASRPVPVLAEAITFTAGAGHMAPLPFLATAATGNLLYALALTANGAALLPNGLLGPGLVIPMGLPVVAWLGCRWRARRGRRGHAAR